MAVIGNSSTQQAFTPAVDYFSGNGSTTAFTLSRPVASVAQVEAVIDNVVQNPSSAYTVSGNTITFTSAPLSGTNNIYVRYTSPITQVIAPGQGTVNTTALAGGTVTTTADATLNGLTVGKGGGSVTQNTVVGASAGSANTTGKITAVGYLAARFNTTGSGNTAIGGNDGAQDGALYYNTTGNYNIAMGTGAVASNTTGSSNTGLGYQALNSNTTASNNTAVGYQAGYSNTTGTRNAFYGMYSGYGITTGTDNTALGYNAIAGGVTVTGSYNTAVGVQSLYNSTTASNNTAVGYQASYSNNQSATTAVGYKAGYANTGDNELVAVGYQALTASTTGTNNTALGHNTLASNTTGSHNLAVGSAALTANTTGSYNTAIGRVALVSNTTASGNTAVGYQAGYGGTTGYGNCAFGYQSLYSLSSGYYNTNIGYQAGSGITSGTNNLCLGQGAGNGGSPSGNLTTQTDRICLGDNNILNAYIKVSWTVTSDARDKADIVDSRYGLNFVNSLRPVEYKWDMRSKYEEGQTPDGTYKQNKTNLGFLAQEVIEAEKANGGVAGDLLIADDESDDLLRITETKMIPVLVKAIQELKALVDAQATEIAELKAKVGV